ncbi:MAG: TatD family deoxyribonuclease [Rikenellaceae bacterium]|nr:TatD family deoxyribonuclease [Rikenellaceae bacterium]
MLIDIHTHRPTEAVTIRAVGVHPWYAAECSLPSAEVIEAADAVGEIGLDKACGVDFEMQRALFVKQLELAERFEMPVVLHCVRAFEEVMTVLERYTLRAVLFHGFIGSREQAERAVKKGYYLSYGARTERSRKTVEALRATPLERLFVETDESPVALEELYQTIALLRGIGSEELKQATANNYTRIFTTK